MRPIHARMPVILQEHDFERWVDRDYKDTDELKKLLTPCDPALLEAYPVAAMVGTLRTAWREDRQIFIFGNGGSASNASHFATDLGKGSSDKLGKRFRVLSLNDNVSWLTAIGNDYSYEDVFVRQLENYARPGDVAMSISVSGNSPNCVKALEWAKAHGLRTLENAGLIRREYEATIPPKVTYSLTERGHELDQVLDKLAENLATRLG